MISLNFISLLKNLCPQKSYTFVIEVIDASVITAELAKAKAHSKYQLFLLSVEAIF